MERNNKANSTDEIEITPAMLDAAREAIGIRGGEFYMDDGGVMLSDEALKLIFITMNKNKS